MTEASTEAGTDGKKAEAVKVAPADRREAIGNPQLASILGLLVPGLGHFYLGRRLRGVAFAVLVFAALGIGVALEGNLFRPIGGQPLTYLATLGSMGMGIPYFVLRFARDYTGSPTAAGYEYGTAFLLTAGLMNLLLVLDAWDIAVGKKD